MTPVTAIGFDLGETLLCYRDTPLSWASLYEPALAAVAAACGLAPSPAQVAAAGDILRRYNTRLVPREAEVGSDLILTAVLTAWQAPAPSILLTAATESFFGFFQQRMGLYPDTLDVLEALRARRLPVGILTDVPYGMPADLVCRDLRAAGIEPFLTTVLTSGEVGWRKPSPAGFLALAARLGTDPGGLLFVGNEAKDVLGARRAGARGVFLDHEGGGATHGQHATIRRLADLLALLG